MIKTKRFPIPLKFHTLIKFEAIKSGKTMTKYMSEVAEEVEERNMKFKDYIKHGDQMKDEKKKFIPRF